MSTRPECQRGHESCDCRSHCKDKAMSNQHPDKTWRQGITLLTAATRRWSKQTIEANNAPESLMVFENFMDGDQGRSRRLVAVCERPEYASLIAAAPETAAERDRLREQVTLLSASLRRADAVNADLVAAATEALYLIGANQYRTRDKLRAAIARAMAQ